MAEKSGQGGKSGPDVVLRFSPVVVYSYLQVFSPARVATWRAFEVPWGQFANMEYEILQFRSA